MRSPFLLTLSFCCLICLVPASADTFLLNNGQSVEGKVVFEDDTYYLVEVQFSEGIKDEKQILKSDIKSVSKLTPDMADFEKLKDLVPVPDLLGVADYESRITILEGFIEKYPRSEMLTKVKKMDKVLKEELEVVREGGIKFSGKMVTADEYLSNAYAYDESISAQKIVSDINNRNLLGALRAFTDYELNFINGKSREDLVPKIKQVLQVYRKTLNDSLAGYDARMKAREDGLERMAADDRQKTERALEEEAVSLKARYDREKSMKSTWITPHEYYKVSITEALRQVDTEIKRLDASPRNELVVQTLEDSYHEAWNALPSATEDDQKKIFEDLKRNGMSENYLAKLRARVSPQE